MKTVDSNTSVLKRRLLLRDGLTVFTLFSIAAVLFGITSFLFSSFESHREDLAKTWSQRGEKQLQQGKPSAAVYSLRAALSYAPDNASYQLLLATALADAGRTDEAINYFLNMWAASPGDGSINLQLARLMRRKGNVQKATEYYRSSIYGNWQGDGTVRRREIRLELAKYLIDQHSMPAARVELSIVAGNAPDDPRLDLTLGKMFQDADDLPDAWLYFKKAVAGSPDDAATLEDAAYVAYDLDKYGVAHSLFTRALRQASSAPSTSPNQQQLSLMQQKTARLLDLDLTGVMSRQARTEHIVADAQIARARVTSCAVQLGKSGQIPLSIQNLQSRWKAVGLTVSSKTLAKNPEDQDAMVKLINETEVQTQQLCGAPTGDDALLALLANKPDLAQNSQQ